MLFMCLGEASISLRLQGLSRVVRVVARRSALDLEARYARLWRAKFGIVLLLLVAVELVVSWLLAVEARLAISQSTQFRLTELTESWQSVQSVFVPSGYQFSQSGGLWISVQSVQRPLD